MIEPLTGGARGWLRVVLPGLLFGCIAFAAHRAGAETLVAFDIKPSDADPAISRFNDDNYVVLNETDSTPQQQLVVFLPGTNGKPRNAVDLLTVVAGQGYRAIGLAYNDSPAIVQVCPQRPPPCSGAVRQRRIFGDDVTSVVENTRAESIVGRLTALLNYLDHHDRDRHWGTYLVDGEPDWNRIVISGLSQGAGMAAYLAKRKQVARVVLFSSPWDFYGSSRELAPWIREPGVTPPDRWFAEYHRRENTAALIARAYRQLEIPADHVRVFDLDLPDTLKAAGSDNPFHGSTIRVRAYADQWRFLFGRSP